MKFDVIDTEDLVQTARMTLEAGEQSGPMGNEHAGSDQVLVVLRGEVRAIVGEREFTMREGDSTIVPRGTAHQFVNAGSQPAETFNVYSPPAY